MIDMRAVQAPSSGMGVYYGPSGADVFDCFLIIGVELELQFLNYISLCKAIEQSRNVYYTCN